jgi:hypothetical protein
MLNSLCHVCASRLASLHSRSALLPDKTTCLCCAHSGTGGYCSRRVNTADGDTCMSLMEAAGIPPVLFYFLNDGSRYYCRDGRLQGLNLCLLNRRGCGKVHPVAPQDTCASIASAKGLEQAMFDKLNPLLDCGKLLEGQLVCIYPGGLAGCPFRAHQ